MRANSLLWLVVSQALVGSASQTGDHDSFKNPRARDRPRFRYWLPDASIDISVLKSDIAAAGALGMGGVELVPFYNYGGQIGGPPQGVDWVEYGFGTPAYLEILNAALEAHDDAGMVMDFAFGPSEGQGVPASSEDEGLQWDLIPFYMTAPADGRVNTTVPGWGTGDLVAIVSATVLESKNISNSVITPPQPQPTNITYERLTLEADSLVDITDKINPLTGLLTAELPVSNTKDAMRICIFSFWQKRTLYRNLQITGSNGSDSGVWANGSYVVDHFSGRGAQVTTDFWDKNILSNKTVADLLRKVGNVGWEDSIELKCNISWSPTLLERFQKKLGYDLRPFLPLITFGNNNIGLQTTTRGIYDATLSSEDKGRGYVNDYRSVLTDGYIEYLQTLRQWLKDVLGLSLSVQPSYNLPIDMLSVIPHVDVPESESLQGSNNIDGYRQFSGPNNLAGNNVISNELGAVFGKAFSLTIPELLHMANRGFAGGLNQYVVHGQPYSGDYPETTWPGHVPFLYHASDMYTAKRPDWDHGLQHAMEYLARIQHVQQQGIQRVDVAIYNKNVTDPFFATVYEDDDLLQAGWSYNYLTADNLDLPYATVENAILSPQRASYKAMVIPGSQNLTSSAVQKIKSYAKEGLPIILTGGSPGHHATPNATDRLDFEESLAELLASPQVYKVDKGKVADKLQSLQLKPQVATKVDNIVHTTWREDLKSGIDYLFAFSDLAPTKGELIVRSTKIPYVFDPWKGSKKPLQHYQATEHHITIPLTLAANQTVIYAFAEEPLDHTTAPGSVHVSKAPPSVIGFAATRHGLQLHIAKTSSSEHIHLSTGVDMVVRSSASPSFRLGPWDLVAEVWKAPQDLYQASAPAIKDNVTMTLHDLVPWASIQGLQNATGLGYYSAKFSWSKSHCGKFGAYLSFQPALHAINVRVNDKQLPPLDPTHPVEDISPYLRQGENEITATVPSTMWNYLRSMLDDLESSGREPLVKLLGIPPMSKNGLIGDVEIIPFERVLVES